MAHLQNANKWYRRLSTGSRWRRIAWHVIYYIGRFFSLRKWNPLKKFSLQYLQPTTTSLIKDLDREKPIVASELSSFEKLPRDMLLEISKHLNLRDRARLAKTNKNLNALFQPSNDINLLLEFVVHGEQDKAEEILKINPKLLLKKATVTDYSGRTFKNITPFQYAVWARDWHMWVMIRKYLSNEEAVHQLQELENQGTAFGKSFDFMPLINALKVQHNHFNHLKRKGILSYPNNYPNKESLLAIGKCQRDLPAHAAQYFCSPLASYILSPEKLRRDLNLYMLGANFSLPMTRVCWFPFDSSSYSLGFDSVIIRCHYDSAEVFPDFRFREVTCREIEFDLNAFMRLNNVINAKYAALKAELNVKQTLKL